MKQLGKESEVEETLGIVHCTITRSALIPPGHVRSVKEPLT
jgi:hypothetical protein